MLRNTGWIIASLSLAFGLIGCGTAVQAPAPPAESAQQAEPTPAPADPTNVVTGEVTEVDPAGNRIVIKTADGTSHTVETDDKTLFQKIGDPVVKVGQGGAAAAKASAEGLKKGSIAVVRVSEKGGKLVGREVSHGFKETVKTSEGVIEHVDSGAKTVAVKTKDGTVEVYDLAEGATVKSGHKVGETSKDLAGDLKHGANATVYWTQEKGKKVARLFHRGSKDGESGNGTAAKDVKKD